MGGPQMRAAGVEIITDYSEVSVVGITEVLKRLPSLYRAMRRLVNEAERRRPPLAILTDFPGFHLRLARKLRPRGIRNVYYICPQFWAWRPWRVNLVRRPVRPGAVYLPFRGKVLHGCRRAGEIHRASARGKREGHTDSGIVLQEIRSGTREPHHHDPAGQPADRDDGVPLFQTVFPAKQFPSQ